MDVRMIRDYDRPCSLHFEHAVENGKGYAQLWVDSAWHFELTEAQLAQFVREAAELLEGLS